MSEDSGTGGRRARRRSGGRGGRPWEADNGGPWDRSSAGQENKGTPEQRAIWANTEYYIFHSTSWNPNPAWGRDVMAEVEADEFARAQSPENECEHGACPHDRKKPPECRCWTVPTQLSHDGSTTPGEPPGQTERKVRGWQDQAA